MLWIFMVLVCLPLFALLPPVSGQTEAKPASQTTAGAKNQRVTYVNDNPNIISAGAVEGITNMGQAMDSFVENVAVVSHKAAVVVYSALRQTGVASAVAGKYTFRLVGGFVYYTASTLANVAAHIPRTIGAVFGTFTKVPVVNAYVRPADSIDPPKIDEVAANNSSMRKLVSSSSPEKANDSLPAANTAAKVVDSGTSWPIHGQVTTLFGVPEWPFQPIHTGMDISSGKPAGAVAIKPFKSGRVIQTVISSIGLGNHVIVDHGGGLTSVYAHLSSITIKTGSDVNTNTTLGYEGSTGASTGPHLHFEIRQNGQPVNPQKFFATSP